MSDPFFKVGGTLASDAPCYVERQADRGLLDALHRGEFCYVLDTRQFGKSSLMSRAASVLRAEGTLVVIIDLNALGESGDAEQWYFGMLDHLGEQLERQGVRVLDALEKHWAERAALAPMPRLMNALRDVVLPATQKRLVIMVDEIDYVRKLARLGTDEFFAGIRECYNRRARDPEFERVTFCLLGVASPSDLIKDSRVTPFNIGTRIELRDFTAAEAATLKAGFPCGAEAAEQIVARVLHWTGGHPYLTQRLCRAVAEDAGARGPADVDRHCEELFLASTARDRDDNLLFVRDRMLRGTSDLTGLLELYRSIRKGRSVANDDANPLVSDLRLAGIVRPVDGRLEVRNRIYFTVFDAAWIDKAMPGVERRRQRRAFARGIAAAVAVVLIGVGVWHVLFVRPRVEYYDDFERHRDGPRGFGKLALGDVQKRASSLRFTRAGWLGPLRRIEKINGCQQLTRNDSLGSLIASGRDADNSAQKVVAIHLSYDGRALRSETGLNLYGSEVWRFDLDRPAGDGSITGNFRAGESVLPQAPSGASQVRLIFDQQGWVRDARFTDGRGEPRPDGYRCFGFRHERDAIGRETRRTVLGPDGKPGWHKDGWTSYEFEFGPRGFISGTRYLDMEGRAMETSDGICQTKREYDAFGNVVERRRFDAGGNPSTDNTGVHLWRMTFDAHGFETSVAYFGVQDRPTNYLNGDARGYARYTTGYDANGCVSENRHFDTQDRPVLNHYGFAGVTYACDERGNRWWTQYLGTDGEPTIIDDGYSALLRQFDERGRLITHAYFDTAAMPTLGKGGIFWWERQWDDFRVVRSSFFGTDGRPALHNEGYAIVRWDFRDPVNRFDWTEKTHLDAEEKQMIDAKNAARVTRRFDGANLVEETFWSTGNAGATTAPSAQSPSVPDLSRKEAGDKAADSAVPKARDAAGAAPAGRRRFDTMRGEELSADAAMSPEGYSRYTRTFDGFGNIKSTTYFAFEEESFKPASPSATDHRMEYEYDPRNPTQAVRSSSFGVNGQPTRLAKITPAVDYAYGRFGKATLVTFHHVDGHISKKRMAYDDMGRRIETAFLDGEGRPDGSSGSHATFREAYDARGNLIRESWFDANDKPMAGPDSVAVREYVYDTRDRRIEMRTLAPDGKPPRASFFYASYRDTLDERGRLVDRRFFDADGERSMNAIGAARIHFTLDARGRVAEERYFDPEDRPTMIKDGYAAKRMTYDARGQVETESYFGSGDGPVRMKDGGERVRFVRDESGRVVEKRFEGFDPARGYALVVLKFDSAGRNTERAIFAADGSPISTKTEAHRQRLEYDANGRMIRGVFFDAAGAPSRSGDGYTEVNVEYGTDGRLTLRRWTGYPADGPFAAGIRRYNARGDETDDEFVDAAGMPATGPQGYAAKRTEFDAAGRVVHVVWLDAGGKQTRGTGDFSEMRIIPGQTGREQETITSGYDPAKGFASRRERANARGTTIEERLFDAGDRPVNGPGGYALRQTEDDEKGRITRHSFFDAEGRPVGDRDGYSVRKYGWSEGGQGSEMILTNADPSRPFATEVRHFDSRGELVETRFLNLDGTPASDIDGAAVIRSESDAQGRVDRIRWLAADGSPARSKKAFNERQFFYDQRGRIIRDAATGYDESLGFAKLVREYDEQEMIIRAYYLDAQNRPVETRPFVEAVMPGGEGERAGIKPGDLLLTYDGRVIADLASLRYQTGAPGLSRRTVRVWRDGKAIPVSVAPGLLGIQLLDRVPVGVPAEALAPTAERR